MGNVVDYAPVVNAAIASLQDAATGLPARIAAYNAEAGHNFELDGVAAENYFFGGNDTLVVFPAVEVAVTDGSWSAFSLGQGDSAIAINPTVSVWLEGATGEIPELYEKALGYGRVVAEVLFQPNAFGQHLTIVNVRAIFPAIPAGNMNPDTRSFDRWRTAAVVEFTLG